MIGKELGPYRILENIGAGGVGKAFDTRLGRVVAMAKMTRMGDDETGLIHANDGTQFWSERYDRELLPAPEEPSVGAGMR